MKNVFRHVFSRFKPFERDLEPYRCQNSFRLRVPDDGVMAQRDKVQEWGVLRLPEGLGLKEA
jgi:hypothetical protein